MTGRLRWQMNRNTAFVRMTALALILALAMAGCTPLRTSEGRVERIWPPPGDDEAKTADLDVTNRSARRSPNTDSMSGPSAAQAGSTKNSNLAPPQLDQESVADPRLSPEQQQQFSRQLAAMSQPIGSGLSNTNSPHTASANSAIDNLLARYISEGDMPIKDDAVAPASSTEPVNPPAAAESTAELKATAEQDSTAKPENEKTDRSSSEPQASDSAAQAETASVESERQTSGAEAESEVEANSDEPQPAAPTEAATSNEPDSAESSGEETEDQEQMHWRRHIGQAIDGIERELADTALSHDERVRLEATLRLLQVADNRDEEAVKPIEPLDTDQQEFWKLSLAGFLELLNPDGPPVDGRRAKLALRHFRDAIYHLAAASSLDVRNFALCQRVDSFGSYKEFEPYKFRPEQEVILYVEVGNFGVEQRDEGYETELQGSYQILDNTGRRVADYELMLDKQTSRNIRTDYFLPYLINMPNNLSPGSYRIQVTIEDKKGHKFGQSPPVQFEISE